MTISAVIQYTMFVEWMLIGSSQDNLLTFVGCACIAVGHLMGTADKIDHAGKDEE